MLAGMVVLALSTFVLIDVAPAVVFIVASDVVLEVCALFFCAAFFSKGIRESHRNSVAMDGYGANYKKWRYTRASTVCNAIHTQAQVNNKSSKFRARRALKCGLKRDLGSSSNMNYSFWPFIDA